MSLHFRILISKMSMCSLSKDLKRAVWSTWLVFPSVDCNYYFQVMFMKVFQKLCESHLNVDMLLMRRRQWHPTPVLLPRKSHRRRSLVGCSPWGRKESDTTGYFIFTFTLFLEPLPSCVVSLPVATPLVPKDEMWPLFPLFRMGRSCQF